MDGLIMDVLPGGMNTCLYSHKSTLYHKCLVYVTQLFSPLGLHVKQFPDGIIFDVCRELFNQKNLSTLKFEISSVVTFNRLLRLTSYRCELHTIFQSLQEYGAAMTNVLYTDYANMARQKMTENDMYHLIDLGLRLGIFLCDAGWNDVSRKILSHAREVCLAIATSVRQKRLLLEVNQHLLRAQAMYCDLKGAEVTGEAIQTLIGELRHINELPNLACVYTNFSNYYFVRNEFNNSYKFSMAALHQLTTEVPPKTQIDTLRQASRSCVVKRQFDRARVLVKQAVDLANAIFGQKHPKYADVQLDFGFFLLNYDSVEDGVKAYEKAYRIRKQVFLRDNINVAVALEDLAYALYVHEYSSGRFLRAQRHADMATDIMERLLPKDHIMLSSAQRVKALILEEIAIDSTDNPSDLALLKEAEKLHLCALGLGVKHFGERNVQTAKHYGNLGRLYQSMRLYVQAEMMHIKAIEIKEALLGPDDYEVGLSLGHLASLYNYHMSRYDKAIELYNRSINISLRLFGSGYSGLEYDYRGLIHIYTEHNDQQKIDEYNILLNAWRRQRESNTPKVTVAPQRPLPTQEVVEQVFEIGPTINLAGDSPFT